MTDLFKKEDVIALLQGKTLLILGGSIQRGIYKDIIWLMNSDTLINRGVLGDKAEARYPDFESDRVSFKNSKESKKLKKIFNEANKDRLHFCGSCEDDFKGLHSGRNYTEVREYFNEEHNIMVIFKFINRISPMEQPSWTDSICSRLRRQLDIVLVNSGLWDVNKVGPLAHQDFRTSLDEFTEGIARSVPSGLCFWLTTPPISEETNSRGMTVSGLEAQNYLSRFNISCINKISSERFSNEVLQVIDLHYFMLSQIAKRNPDGIHWNPEANRMMTNKILTHLCLATDQNLPGRNNSPALERLKILSRGFDQTHKEEFERKLVMKHGDMARVRAWKLDVTVCKQVTKRWWDVRGRGKFRFHLEDMSRRVVLRQGLQKLELPPLEFIARTLSESKHGEDERLSNLNFGQSQSKFGPHNLNPLHPVHQPQPVKNFNEFNRYPSQTVQSFQQSQVWPVQEVSSNYRFGQNNSTSQNVVNYEHDQSQSFPYEPRHKHPNSQIWGSNENFQNQPRESEILNPAMVYNDGLQNHSFHDQVESFAIPRHRHPNSQIFGSNSTFQQHTNSQLSESVGSPRLLNPAMVHNVGHQNHSFHDQNIRFRFPTRGGKSLCGRRGKKSRKHPY